LRGAAFSDISPLLSFTKEIDKDISAFSCAPALTSSQPSVSYRIRSLPLLVSEPSTPEDSPCFPRTMSLLPCSDLSFTQNFPDLGDLGLAVFPKCSSLLVRVLRDCCFSWFCCPSIYSRMDLPGNSRPSATPLVQQRQVPEVILRFRFRPVLFRTLLSFHPGMGCLVFSCPFFCPLLFLYPMLLSAKCKPHFLGVNSPLS